MYDGFFLDTFYLVGITVCHICTAINLITTMRSHRRTCLLQLRMQLTDWFYDAKFKKNRIPSEMDFIFDSDDNALNIRIYYNAHYVISAYFNPGSIFNIKKFKKKFIETEVPKLILMAANAYTEQVLDELD